MSDRVLRSSKSVELVPFTSSNGTKKRQRASSKSEALSLIPGTSELVVRRTSLRRKRELKNKVLDVTDWNQVQMKDVIWSEKIKDGKKMQYHATLQEKRSLYRDQKKKEAEENKRLREKRAKEWRTAQGDDSEKDEEEEKAEELAPQVQLTENGEIKLNDESLQLRRKFSGAQVEDLKDMGEESYKVGADAFKKRKRSVSRAWKVEETRLFYKGLRMYGQNFSSIEHLFPNRDKRQILNKFRRESREKPKLIRMALSVKARLKPDKSLFSLKVENKIVERLGMPPLLEDLKPENGPENIPVRNIKSNKKAFSSSPKHGSKKEISQFLSLGLDLSSANIEVDDSLPFKADSDAGEVESEDEELKNLLGYRNTSDVEED